MIYNSKIFLDFIFTVFQVNSNSARKHKNSIKINKCYFAAVNPKIKEKVTIYLSLLSEITILHTPLKVSEL